MEALSGLIFAAFGAGATGLLLRWHVRRTVRAVIAQAEADKRRRRSEAVARGNRTRALKRAEAVRAKAEELTATAGAPIGFSIGGNPFAPAVPGQGEAQA